jgi:hypothetical protein
MYQKGLYPKMAPRRASRCDGVDFGADGPRGVARCGDDRRNHPTRPGVTHRRLREKALAAMRAGLKTMLVPSKNQRDMVDVPSRLRKRIKFVL